MTIDFSICRAIILLLGFSEQLKNDRCKNVSAILVFSTVINFFFFFFHMVVLVESMNGRILKKKKNPPHKKEGRKKFYLTTSSRQTCQVALIISLSLSSGRQVLQEIETKIK